ncbi:hypothetical protein ACFQH6_19280 [Halobacteriaceae archaeon GCM10025711]
MQRPQTSIAFLYQGPERLSLVVVHGSVDAADGGAVTFRLSGLPADGEWFVKDDYYSEPGTNRAATTNYDTWTVDGADHRIDWTWGSGGTDGGAFGGLGDDFDVAVDPAFNEAAALYGEHYDGTVTAWEFLSGPDGGERISLGMDAPIRIATGGCDGEPAGKENEEGRQPEREDDSDDDQDSDDDDQDGDDDKDDKDGDDEVKDDDDDDDGEKYTVCHRPPGNPDNAHTIQVGSEAAREAHLGHGDSRGACSGDD